MKNLLTLLVLVATSSVFAQLNPTSIARKRGRLAGPSPVANAGVDITCYTGEAVRLDGSSSTGYSRGSQANGLPSVTWDFGDGTSAEHIIKPAHAYLSPGTYTVRLTIRNSSGAASSDTAVVNVLPIVASHTRELVDSGDSETNRINLQAAINAAAADSRAGEIVVPNGFVANDPINLPARSFTNYVTIRTSMDLPSNQRVTKADVWKLFKIRARGASESRYNQAITINGDSNYYRFIGVYIERSGTLKNDVIAVDTYATASRPSHLIFDRIVIDGNGTDTIRGVAPNGSYFSLLNSSVLDIKAAGDESKAVGAWTGGGPLAIINNRLEGASINVLIGGSTVSSASEILDGFDFRSNYVWKSPDWVVTDGVGRGYGVKNLFELKWGRNVGAVGNVFENNYQDAQSGEAVVIKSAAQNDAANPFAEISGLDFRNNKILNTRAGFSIIGIQSWIAPHPPYANHIFFTNNFWQERSGRGNLLLTPDSFEINHNTFVRLSEKSQWGMIEPSTLPPDHSPRQGSGLKILNSVMYSSAYGSIFSSFGEGTMGLNYGFTSWDVRGNLFDGSRASAYPSGNFFSAAPGQVGTDGTAIGVNQSLLEASTQTAITGRLP